MVMPSPCRYVMDDADAWVASDKKYRADWL